MQGSWQIAPTTLAAVSIGRSVTVERKPATNPGDDDNRVQRQYLRFAGVGVQYAVTILMATLGGIWLDGRFDTGSLFTIVLLLLAFVGATWSLVQGVLAPDKPKQPNQQDKQA